MKRNKFLDKLYATLNFGGSKSTDSTPGGIPFLFMVALVPLMLVAVGLVYLAFRIWG